MPLRKICRRPETDYRLQQLHAVHEQQKSGMDPAPVHAIRVTTSAETQNQQNANFPISASAQSTNVNPSKAERAPDVTAAHSMFPVGTATFTTNTVTSSVPGVTSQNMAEGK